MASIMTLRPSIEGMDRFLNVDARVGPFRDCPNNPQDVEAIQRLISIAAGGAVEHGLPLPLPTGRFDLETGFYIFVLQAQASRRGRTGAVVDGVISPARGAVYGAGTWAIVNLNSYAFGAHRFGWEEVLRRFGNNSFR